MPGVDPAGEQAAVRAAIAARVHIRFTTDADRLTDRVLALASAAGAPAADVAARLLLDDLYLATACADGDERAWAEFQAAHFRFIRDFAQRFLPDAAARDLADQVIADLWQRGKIARYEGRSTLRTWLGTLVAHAAINAGRSRRATMMLASEDVDGGTAATHDPAGRESARLLRTIVEQCVAALPAEDKLLLQLYYEQGMTLDAMEAVTGLSRATSSRRLAALRARLRAAVDEAARRTAGSTADALRRGVALDRLEFDLSSVLGGKR